MATDIVAELPGAPAGPAQLSVQVPGDEYADAVGGATAAAESLRSHGGLLAAGSGANSCSKRKLDELFYYWLSLEETKDMITSLVDDVKSGRGLPQAGDAVGGGTNAPLSPVSKLLKANKSVVAPWSPGGGPNTPPR
eukprot:SAG31_NODE_3352_length_4370_cov_3.025749_5_plen_137_part_00